MDYTRFIIVNKMENVMNLFGQTNVTAETLRCVEFSNLNSVQLYINAM